MFKVDWGVHAISDISRVQYKWLPRPSSGYPQCEYSLHISIPIPSLKAFCRTGIPGVIPNLATSPPVAIADVFFWTPQVIGGSGFIIASLLLMVEVQKKWWLPNLTSVGWYALQFIARMTPALKFIFLGTSASGTSLVRSDLPCVGP